MEKNKMSKKKKKGNKGFTLIELLATISLLALLSVIVIYTLTNVVGVAKSNSYTTTIKNIERASEGYALEDDDNGNWKSIGTDSVYKCITVENLMDKGYFSNDILDSKIDSDRNVLKDDYIYVERNNDSKTITESRLLDESLKDDLCGVYYNTSGEINFFVPSGFAKEKEVKITYILDIDDIRDLENYEYRYNFDANTDGKDKGIYFQDYDDKSVKTFTETVVVDDNGKLNAQLVCKDGKDCRDFIDLSENVDVTGIDNNGPIVELIVNNGSTYKKEHEVTIKLSDDMSGFKKGSYEIKYGWSDNVLNCNNLTDSAVINISRDNVKEGNVKVKINNGNGRGKLYACAVDSITDFAGNELEDISPVDIWLDTLGPVINLGLYNGSTVVRNSVTIPLVVTDDYSGVNHSTFDKSDIKVMVGDNTLTTNSITLNKINDIDYNLVINNSTKNGKIKIIIDNNKIFDNATNGNSKTELNPNIEFKNEYSIQYIANGGTGSMSNTTCNVGDSCALRENGFIRNGYTFIGWNTKADGSGNSYSDEQNVTLTSNLTLYAQWNTQTTIITINKDGSSWPDSGMKVCLSTRSNTNNFANNLCSIVTSGSSATFSNAVVGTTYYIYAGKNDASKTSMVKTNQSFKGGENKVVNYYTLELDKDNGIQSVGGDGIYLSGQSASISAVANTGYIFSEWDNNEGNSPRSTTSASTSVTLSQKTKLTAISNVNPTTVTINKDGGAWTGSGIKLCLSRSSSTNDSFSCETVSIGSNVTFSNAVVGTTYYIYAGKNDASKTSMVKTNQTITGGTSQTVNYYTITRSQGTGTTLTTKYGNSSGTVFTNNPIVLSGQTIYAKATVSSGYKDLTLKHGADSMNTNGGTFIVSGTETISSSASVDANKVIIKYSINGGTLNSNYPWGNNNNGIITKNGSVWTTEIEYNNNIGAGGLTDYNDSNNVNITKSDHSVNDGYEWICSSGCTTSNKVFSQSSTSYKASDFCDASSSNCTVTLEVNWVSNVKYRVDYEVNIFSPFDSSRNILNYKASEPNNKLLDINYNHVTSNLTFNSYNKTSRLNNLLIGLNPLSFNSGDKYEIILTHVSGSYSGGKVYMKVGAMSNSASMTANTSLELPKSGSVSQTITVNNRYNGYLKQWMSSDKAGDIMFDNYVVNVVIRKKLDGPTPNGLYQEFTPGTNAKYVIPSGLSVPVKLGYNSIVSWRLLGSNNWWTDGSVTNNTPITINYDHKVYAKLNPKTLKVTYNGNGGDIGITGYSSYVYNSLDDKDMPDEVTLKNYAGSATNFSYFRFMIQPFGSSGETLWFGCTDKMAKETVSSYSYEEEYCLGSQNPTLGWYTADKIQKYYTRGTNGAASGGINMANFLGFDAVAVAQWK